MGNQQDFSEAKNITQRLGYDNQPAFSQDSHYLFFTSIARDSQADIACLQLDNMELGQITKTGESEYSPTPINAAGSFTVVRVEKDSTQRIWLFSRPGKKPKVLFKKIKKIGYHAWTAKDEAAFFILGEPHYLLYAGPGKKTVKVDTAIGRCLQKMPDEKAVTYVSKADSNVWMLRKYSPETNQISDLVKMPAGVEDYAWTPWKTIWAFDKGSLLEWKTGNTWTEIANFSQNAPGVFYRLAVSPDGKWLSMVSIEGKLP